MPDDPVSEMQGDDNCASCQNTAAEAKESFPTSDSDVPVVPCEPGPPSPSPPPPPCPADTIKKNIEKCDGGTDIWNKAQKGTGKTPTIKVSGAAGGFGGHADLTSGEVVVSPNPDCCGATQTGIHELTNLSNAKTFAKTTKDAAAGDLSRTDYIKANEKTEYEGVSNAVKAFDACKAKWGCAAGAKARHDWIRGAKDFDDYYDNFLATSHKEYWGKAWDDNYKAAYDNKHP